MTTARPHGNAKYHLERCRCSDCRKAASEYANNRHRAIAYGRWQPYVDAEPVRQHVRALGEFGIGWMRLARLADIPRGSVSKLLYGDPPRGLAPSRRMRAKNALALLAVEPTLDNLGARTRIDGTGTRRRLQALVAAGWTQSELARRLDMEPANFAKTINSELVVAGTTRAARSLYDQLWRLDPTEHGLPPHLVKQARRLAAAKQWAPVGAWDDDTIDDPAAFADWTGRCGTSEGYRAHYRHKIPCCQPCRDAHAAERRTRSEAAA